MSNFSPLGPGGALGRALYPELNIGEEVSVLNELYPHNGHIDATLYRKFPDGKIYPVDKVHLDPNTYEPLK